jgi:phage/plasmid-associated DNA primase
LYDIKKNRFEKGIKDTDYLTETIPYNYMSSNDEDKQKVRDILFKICNCNEKNLEYYLSILGFSMIGDPEKEKSMYFLIGNKGNNGKTLIMNTLADIMPNYCKKNDRLTFEEDYKKSHKNLISVKGKRIVYMEELSEKKLNIELLKE